MNRKKVEELESLLTQAESMDLQVRREEREPGEQEGGGGVRVSPHPGRVHEPTGERVEMEPGEQEGGGGVGVSAHPG